MIKWKELWEEFNKWFDRGKHYYSWPTQQKKIEKLVLKYTKGKP